MALIKIIVDRKTGQTINTEIIDTNTEPDYEPLARYLAQKFLDEYKGNS